MLRFLGIIFALMVMFAPGQAYAVCGGPAGNPGDIVYNETEKIFQYCADNTWKRMNTAPGTGSGGCTSPTLAEGQMVYNADHRVLQGCAGNVYRPFGIVGGVNEWTTLSTGTNHTCGIKNDGSLWCWGLGNTGQLGSGTTASANTPRREVTTAANWKNVSASQSHTCAVKTDGSLWCWGSGANGRLGNGGVGQQNSPVRESTNATNWASVSAGDDHTCATKHDGSLWCWGSGANGRLGNGGTGQQNSPVRESTYATNWKNVSAGNGFACATKIDGSLWCWGVGNAGRLGNGGTGQQTSPVRESTNATNWKGVSAGETHACATKTDGSLWCWGAGTYGRLANGGTGQENSPVREITNAVNWASVEAGFDHTCATKNDGSLWCWGAGRLGQLGNNDTPAQTSPVRESTNASNWLNVSAGYNYSCGIKSDGLLLCWGNNVYGQLAIGSDLQIAPKRESTNANNWQNLSNGGDACAIKSDGSMWCWGDNSSGTLAMGDNNARVAPTRESTNATDWQSVSMGNNHACAIKTNGSLWCWGQGNFGRLGTGNTSNQLTPTREVTNANNWQSVKVGTDSTCAIKTNGTLWCWGSNDFSQLGDGGTTQQNSPVQEATNATDWQRVSISHSHTCAIKTNGTLWCWGAGNNGKLGTGNTSSTTAPTREITNANNWRDVITAQENTCAIKTDGSLWCWGQGLYGMLGNGGTANSSTPVRESTNSSIWNQISTGQYTSSPMCATQTDGSLWCWGYLSGQLGDENYVIQLAPGREPSWATDWQNVAQGNGICALKTDNSAWCWGPSNGALGYSPDRWSPKPARCGSISNIHYKPGALLYSSAVNLMQYCDGAGWVGIGGGTPPLPGPEGIPTLGLYSYWPMNENTGTNVADITGNGLNATAANTSWQATGKLGSALDFNGTTSVVTAGATSWVNNMARFSISAWIYPRGLGEGNHGRIIGKSGGTDISSDGWMLNMTNDVVNGLAFTMDFNSTHLSIVSDANAYTLNNWTHIALTWDGTPAATSVKLYVNGTEVTTSYTNGGSGARADDSANVVMIGNNPANSRTFDGYLDEVRIYDRALSVAEVRALAGQ